MPVELLLIVCLVVIFLVPIFFDVNVGIVDDDGDVQEIPSEQFTVARIKRRIFAQSTIGAIYTRRCSEAPFDGGECTTGLAAEPSSPTIAGRSGSSSPSLGSPAVSKAARAGLPPKSPSSS